jgi:hypothetical protein
LDQLGVLDNNEGTSTAIGTRSQAPESGSILQATGVMQDPNLGSVHQTAVTGATAAQQVGISERVVDKTNQPDVSEIERLKAENPSLVGIGGWLKWFCIVIIFLSPLFFLVEALNDKDTLIWVVDIALSGWYVFTGIMMWKMNNRALRYVAILLIAQFCLGGLALIGSVTNSGGSSSSSDGVAGMRALVSTFIWYLYFHFSKRVRLTFGRNL